jgi:hypothetical protein
MPALLLLIAGLAIHESHPHNIRITKESPNYTIEHARE